MIRFQQSKFSLICVVVLCLLLIGCTRARPEPNLPTPAPSETPVVQDLMQATSISVTSANEDTSTSVNASENINNAVSTTSSSTVDSGSVDVPVVPTAVSIISETATDPDETSNVAIHTVQPGENLYRIALTYNVELDELVSLNNLSSADVIYVGQEIKVPGITSVSGTAGNVYIVQPGDTLSSIAFRYGVSTQEILFENTLESADVIFVGQQLAIP